MAGPLLEYDVVIVGAGVIGCSCSYFLSQKDPKCRICVVEPCEIAAAASGRSGGFLAQSWCDGDPREALARSSYAMFPELAAVASKEFGLDIHYRTLNTRSLAADRGGQTKIARAHRERDTPTVDTLSPSARRDAVLSAEETREAYPWLDARHFGSSPMCASGSIDTAQVHPRLYTRFLAQASASRGVTFLRARCSGLERVSSGDAGQQSVRITLSPSLPPDASRAGAPEHTTGPPRRQDKGSAAGAKPGAVGESPGPHSREPMAPSPLQDPFAPEAATGSGSRAIARAEASAECIYPREAPTIQLKCRHVVLAMGPWTGGAEGWVKGMLGSGSTTGAGTGSGTGTGGGSTTRSPSSSSRSSSYRLPVDGARCHSVVLRPSVPVDPPCALFVGYDPDRRAEAAAEEAMLHAKDATGHGAAEKQRNSLSDEPSAGAGAGAPSGAERQGIVSLSARKRGVVKGPPLSRGVASSTPASASSPSSRSLGAEEEDAGDAGGAPEPKRRRAEGTSAAADGPGKERKVRVEKEKRVEKDEDSPNSWPKTRPRLGSIEVYPRPDGTVYAVAGPDAEPLPACAGAVQTDPGWAHSVRVAAGTLAESWAVAGLEARQACYLPGTPDSMPVLGRVPGLEQVIVAAGHSCWGILLSPATGRAVAELVLEGKSRAVDLGPFSPGRFAGMA